MTWDGQDRREKETVSKLAWVQTLAPALVFIAGGGMAYGGIKAQMDSQGTALQKLEALPLQLANFRSELNSAVSAIRLDEAARVNEISQRISTVEAIAKRNAGNLETIWPRIRQLEGH